MVSPLEHAHGIFGWLILNMTLSLNSARYFYVFLISKIWMWYFGTYSWYLLQLRPSNGSLETTMVCPRRITCGKSASSNKSPKSLGCCQRSSGQCCSAKPPKRWLKVRTSRCLIDISWRYLLFFDLFTPRLETSQFVYLLTFNLDVGLFTCYQYVSIVSSYTHRVCDKRHPLVQQHVRTIMSWGTDLLNLQPKHSYMESEIATYILRSPKSISKRRFSTGIIFSNGSKWILNGHDSGCWGM